MSLQLLLSQSIENVLKDAVPDGWTVQAGKHFRLLVDSVDNREKPFVAIIPSRIAWKRTARGRLHTEHEINLIVTGRELDVDATVKLIDSWARLFLDEGGPVDDFPCMEAVTLDEAEAGYDIDELTKTPSQFFGGLKLTFWGN
jgi:hypothetical protein